MTHAKDTFYILLRDRLAAINPNRTVSLRGVVRPGIVVEENELPTNDVLPDIFRLRWTGLAVDPLAPLPLTTIACEILYATAGTAANAGMDRGRMLSQMDSELSTALRTAPHHARKINYTSGTPVPMATNIFWSDPVFGAIAEEAERIERVATVQIFAYQEAGE